MVEAKKSDDIGMKRGRVLPNLPQPKQLDVIAEGLPILMKSAGDLLGASKALVEPIRSILPERPRFCLRRFVGLFRSSKHPARTSATGPGCVKTRVGRASAQQ